MREHMYFYSYAHMPRKAEICANLFKFLRNVEQISVSKKPKHSRFVRRNQRSAYGNVTCKTRRIFYPSLFASSHQLEIIEKDKTCSKRRHCTVVLHEAVSYLFDWMLCGGSHSEALRRAVSETPRQCWKHEYDGEWSLPVAEASIASLCWLLGTSLTALTPFLMTLAN